MAFIWLPLIGLASGTIGGLTGTGGGLTVVPALLLMGYSKETAIATSFLSMIFLALISVGLHGMKGTVDWKVGMLVAVGAVVGAIAANYMHGIFNETTFRYAFAVFLVIMAGTLVFKS